MCDLCTATLLCNVHMQSSSTTEFIYVYGRDHGSPCGDVYHTDCVTVLWSEKCSKCIAFMAVEYYWEDDRCWVLQHIFLFHWEHTKLPSQQRNILIKDTIQTCTRVICKAKGKKRRNDAGMPRNCSSNNTAAATGRVGQVGTEIIALSQFSSSMLA